jgi:hypothetical protein
VTLHESARNQSHDDVVLWGANTVLGKFDAFLGENSTYGYAILDRLPVEHSYRYIKEKFQRGMTFPDRSPIRLSRILGFAQEVNGSSHMCSVADIMLGAFRYCVNEPGNPDAGKAMFPILMEMMWKRDQGVSTVVNDYGLVFRPATIDETKYQTDCDALASRLFILSGLKKYGPL